MLKQDKGHVYFPTCRINLWWTLWGKTEGKSSWAEGRAQKPGGIPGCPSSSHGPLAISESSASAAARSSDGSAAGQTDAESVREQEKCKSLIWPTVLRSPRMNWPRLTLWYFSWQHTWGCVWQMKETFQPDDPVSPCFGPSITLAVNDQSVLQPRWRS